MVATITLSVKGLQFFYIIYFLYHIYFGFRYDPKKLDPTWICVFCHQGSHHSGLGDLFGPYFVSPNVVDMSPRNMSSMGSPTYIHPLSPSPSKSKQELAVKFIIGINQSHILEYSLFSITLLHPKTNNFL